MQTKPHSTGSADARLCETEHSPFIADNTGKGEPGSLRPDAPSPFGAPDLALEAAVTEAGEHPERTAGLAKGLGIGLKQASILKTALGGEALPPPIHDEFWHAPPEGSFDAGIARAMGEQYVYDFAEWVRGNGYPISGLDEDVTGDLQEEVKRSFGFARYAVMLSSAIRNELEESPEDVADSVESSISRMAATAFLGGWYMGCEHEDARRANGGSDRVAELVYLFREKVHLGSVDDAALTSGGENTIAYWTQEQVDRARRIVRHEVARKGGAR